jgi:hypothetical protein
MNETKFIMLDIETLDVIPSSHILQVSAVAFDSITRNNISSFSMNVDYETADKQHPGQFTIGENTVKFWNSKSEELIESVFSNDKPLEEVLRGFSDFYRSVKAQGCRKIWCHCDFDIPILKHAYDVCGIRVPWNFKDRLDIRTIVLAAGINLNDYNWTRKTHNSLDDCLFQIDYVCDCLQKIRGNFSNDAQIENNKKEVPEVPVPESPEIIPETETELKLRNVLGNDQKKVSDDLMRSFEVFQKFCGAYEREKVEDEE